MENKRLSQKPGSSRQKKVAVINDMTGFGRCALAVALPVISKLKVQCCPVPTAILSNHTAYPSCYFDDYTEHMEAYIGEWKKLDLTFDGIGTGFLGSRRQIAIVKEFIQNFCREDTIVMVDPIMGDNGKAYATYTKDMCAEMKLLAACGDIVTPNVTEGCILADMPYHEGTWKEGELLFMAERIAETGPGKVVITGIPQGSYIGNFCYDKTDGKGSTKYVLKRTKQVGASRCGTGDIFSSIILADAVNKVELEQSVKRAADFIKDCIRESIRMEVPLTDGVCFEEVLHRLKV
ncbi:MAG: pyridoxamine kinase [Hungatella sp.]|nr:pyridoxamine kinase [Hungatella sp.]